MKYSHNRKTTRNYFYFKLGFSDKAFLKVLDEYGKQVFHEMKLEPTHDSLCDKIQSDWDAFMKVWGTIKQKFKNDYFQNKHFKTNKKYNEYDDIREALQYTNGAADDF